MKKKLTLKQLKVESFTTEKAKVKAVVGGSIVSVCSTCNSRYTDCWLH